MVKKQKIGDKFEKFIEETGKEINEI